MKSRLFKIAWEHRRTFTSAIVLQVLQSVAGMLTIVLFQRVIDGLSRIGATNAGSGIGKLIGTALIAYVILTAINHALIYAQEYPQRLFQVGTFFSVKRLAMRKLARIHYPAYSELDSGTTVQIVENGATAGSSMLHDFWRFVFVTLLTLPVKLYLIYRYDIVILLTVLIGYAGLFGVAQFLMRASSAAMERVVSKKEELTSRFVRGFLEMVSLRVQRRFGAEIHHVDELSRDVAKSEGKIRLVNELFFTGFALLVFAVEVIVIIRQARLITQDLSTVGALVALVMFTRSVFAPVSSFSFAYVGYKMNKVAWRRFTQFLRLPDDQKLSRTDGVVVGSDGDIDIRNVVLRYHDRVVLKEISLRAAAGRLTAIVGSSGVGKSSLLKLTLGLLSPDEGDILIDGVSLSDIDIHSFYKDIIFVSQDAPVMAGSLRENLGIGAQTKIEAIDEALRITRLETLVGAMEQGLETEIGERGVNLSTGERQRIALCRALLSSASRVILDEPTSALDSETEHEVMSELLRSLKGRTVVLVAHRLQPVRHADEIFVVEDGAVVESGTFDALIESYGRFCDLWNTQTRN
jgi:ATP-binding cassette, subfamily B, bacterial